MEILSSSHYTNIMQFEPILGMYLWDLPRSKLNFYPEPPSMNYRKENFLLTGYILAIILKRWNSRNNNVLSLSFVSFILFIH